MLIRLWQALSNSLVLCLSGWHCYMCRHVSSLVVSQRLWNR